ncbi:hypothetical protein [Paenilisteria weihenstephanensis]|nr:hypothetical protein [Listeria weihenstephanensis]
MIKELENDVMVSYKFGPNEQQLGIIEFNKKARKFKVVEEVNEPHVSNEAYEHWAIERIVRVVAREGSVFPARMVVEK